MFTSRYLDDILIINYIYFNNMVSKICLAELQPNNAIASDTEASSMDFKKIVKSYIRVGYNLGIMRQSACLVLNLITVYSYGFLFNCTTVDQTSVSMTALT